MGQIETLLQQSEEGVAQTHAQDSRSITASRLVPDDCDVSRTRAKPPSTQTSAHGGGNADQWPYNQVIHSPDAPRQRGRGNGVVMPQHRIRTNFSLIEVKKAAAADLLSNLDAERYKGPVTSTVIDQLWLYGWVNLHARLSDGGIARLGSGPGARDITEQHLERFVVQSTRDDLVHTTLEGAVPRFVTVLQQGRYDPEKGTTIATYFTGFTFSRFRTQVHPKWADQTMRHEYELGQVQPDDEWYSAARAVPDHADDVVHDLALRQAVIQVVKNIASITERPVALGILRGQTHSEIAAELGITPKAVEHRLASLRKKAWTYRPDTSSDEAEYVDNTNWFDDWVA
jgi:DNA-directed RNA polymerase specialized sigma24 family protein